MAQERIERSCDRDRGFTDAEIDGFIQDTKRRKAQPGYAAREAKRIAEVERRAKLKPSPFPELAKRKGTAPTLVDKQIAGMRLNNLIR